jgi:hypothetical protein
MGLVALAFLGYAWQTQQIRREHDLQLPKGQSITIPLGIALACDVYIVALIFAILRPQNRPGALRMTLLLAGISTAIVTTGLLRVHIRVSSDSNPAEDAPTPLVARHIRAARLPALAYLPADSNVVMGFNISGLMETPAGRQVLANHEPGKSWDLVQIQNWIGLDIKDIDYVVAGLRVDNHLLPRLILVIETSRPFESNKLRESIKTGKWPDPEAIRFPTNHTIILALNKKDLPQTTSDASVGVDHLSTPLKTALNERIAPGVQVWAAGYAEDWEKTLALTYLAALPQNNRDILKNIQTFTVSFHVNNDVTFHAGFQCQDEASAQALREYLGNEKIIGLTDVKTSQKETWASIQAKATDFASLSKLLRIPNGSLSIDDRKRPK